MGTERTILYVAPDSQIPSGGVRTLYRHVDLLNRNGFDAAVLHQEARFRCRWFDNDTRILYPDDIEPSQAAYLVVPAYLVERVMRLVPSVRKVVFNQGCYLTFKGIPPVEHPDRVPYFHPEVVATLVVSEDSERYLRYAFPGLRVVRVQNSIDPTLFRFEASKHDVITYMPRRLEAHQQQVFSILKIRGALAGFELRPIANLKAEDVARALGESFLFLSFSRMEGFGLPPAEAMACGCIVVGYHGMGGREYFRPEFCYPIEFGHIIDYAQCVEQVLRLRRERPGVLREKAEHAARFIRDRYSPAAEERALTTFWDDLIKSPVLPSDTRRRGVI